MIVDFYFQCEDCDPPNINAEPVPDSLSTGKPNHVGNGIWIETPELRLDNDEENSLTCDMCGKTSKVLLMAEKYGYPPIEE